MNIHTIKDSPFPYAATLQCLPQNIYEELANTRPEWELIAGKHSDKNNKRADIPAHSALQNGDLSPIWREFINYHTSQDFYRVILKKFGAHFKKAYPQFDFDSFKTGIRSSDAKADIYLDCQISINTPVIEQSTVSKPHLDSNKELWASLLYMPEPEDKAGGDLVIYKCRGEPQFYDKRQIREDNLIPVAQVPYWPNAMGCFMNSSRSIHAVTERKVTSRPRLFANISLEFMGKTELFKVPDA